MSATDDTRVYTTTHRYSDFAPAARISGGDIWASPDGDIDIVLSAAQWSEWIAQIQQQIDALPPAAAAAGGTAVQA